MKNTPSVSVLQGNLNLSTLIEDILSNFILRTGITVYGYASPLVAPWTFQVDNGAPEALSVQPDLPCRVLKDSQGLKDGKHRVVVTPQSSTFVITKFTYVSFNSSFMHMSHDPCLFIPPASPQMPHSQAAGKTRLMTRVHRVWTVEILLKSSFLCFRFSFSLLFCSLQ